MNSTDFDLIPTWTVDEAFAAFHKWVADNFDEVGDLDLEEQLVRYDAEWVRRNN